MCVGLRVCMCMCVLERISVDVCVLRRMSVITLMPSWEAGKLCVSDKEFFLTILYIINYGVYIEKCY